MSGVKAHTGKQGEQALTEQERNMKQEDAMRTAQ